MKSLKAAFSFLLIALMTLGTARAGQVTGTFATPGGSFIQNATVTFTLSQLAVKTDASQTVAPSTVSCYTSVDGSLVGLPNPQASPVLAATSGSMTAGTYYEVITYWNASGETIASPEQTVVLSSSQGIQTSSPGLQPVGASGYKIYVGITPGGEVLQATVTGFATTSIGSLIGGSSPPISNSTPCNIAFNDTFIPAYTTYRVSALDSTGSPLPGFPQSFYLQGSTVNLNTMLPASGLNARFPQPIVASPINTTTQSINSNLSLNGHNLLNANVNGIVSAGNYATFALALAACPTPGTLLISSAITVSANASVPSTCSLKFLKPGILNIATATTVTINSVVIAPDDAAIFSLTGTGTVAGLTFTRPEWFGGATSAAVLAAYNSCGTLGCKIALRDLGAATEYDFSWSGTHATEITKTEIEIAGSGMAEYNSQTAPTGYTGGGTVVKGPVWVMADPAGPANGFKIHDLSVDNINGVTGADGVFINNNFPSGSTNGPPFVESVRVSNVRTLGRNSAALFHSFLCDNCDGAVFENTESIYNVYGLVMKGQRYRSSRHYGRGHGTACIYPKSDSSFGSSIDISISHAKCEKLAVANDGAGMFIDSQLTANNVGLRIDDYVGRGLTFCLSMAGTNDQVTDVSLSNFLCDGNNTGIALGGALGVSGVTISNGTVKNSAGGDGIQIQNANVTNVAISNVLVSGNSGNGITNALGTGITLSNIRAFNNGVWGVQSTGSACVSGLTGSGNASGLLAPTGLTACTNGPLTLVNGALLSYGRIASVGSIPSCSVTGAGASATCTIGTGSTDSFGLIAIGAAGAGPAATGTLTITLTAALGTHSTSCLLLPSNTGSAAWNARATFFQSNTSTTAPVMTWDNNAVALVAASSYQLSYTCFGL